MSSRRHCLTKHLEKPQSRINSPRSLNCRLFPAMSQRRAILISNPKTGRYGARRPPQLGALCDYLRRNDIEVEQVSTSGPGDATCIAARAANDGFGEVIVFGGDGTINEALQGMIGTKARLGI